MKSVVSIFKAILCSVGYYGVHVVCAMLLPFSSAGNTVFANGIVVALVVIAALLRRRSPLKAIGARPMCRTRWLAAAGAGVGGCALVQLMMRLPFPESWMRSYTERVELVHQAPAWVLVLSTVLIAPIAEEVVFRGLIYRTLKHGTNGWVAAVLSSAMFAVLHGTIMWMVYTCLLGLLLVWLYEKTHSLWACVACHMAFNIAGQLPLGGVLPDIVSLAILAVGVVLFLYAVRYIQKAVQGY